MKRQHPDNPDLFWCPKCKTYKARDDFWRRSNRPSGIQSKCKACMKQYYVDNPDAQRARGLKYSQTHTEKKKEWYENNKTRMLSLMKRLRDENPHKWDGAKKKYNDMARAELLDSYIKKTLNQVGSIVTPETIKLKRQQIIMIRTLKQFKEWRKEYESNNADVQREQRENEETDGRQGHAQS